MSVQKTYQLTITFSSSQGIDDYDASMLEFIEQIKCRIKNSVFPVVDTGALQANCSDITEV